MMQVLIKDFLKPPKEESASTRPQGKRVRLFILENWPDVDQFNVMFEKGLRATISFMDEAFAKLLEGYSLDEFAEKVKFGRLSEYNEQLLVKAVSNRIVHGGNAVDKSKQKAKK